MILIPTIVLCILFVTLAAIHIYWVLGGKWGWETAIPTRNGEPLFEPGRFQTLMVAAALLAAMVVALWRGVYPDLGPIWIPHSGIWVITGIFTLRAIGDFQYCGLFKKVRDTTFSRNDSRIYVPICLVIAGFALWLAVGL
jgi:hypothetical protein